MVKPKLQYLATWWKELTHWKRPWCWERLKVRGEGDNRKWDGWMVSLTQWTWVWVNSGSWWWTGRPGMLLSMGSQRVRHDWVTELNWTMLNHYTVHLKLRKILSSVQFSHSIVSDSSRPHGPQHARLPCPSPTPRVYSTSSPLRWWCRPTILSSDVPSSSRLQSFPPSGCFQMSQVFASGSQSIGVSASTSVLPMNTQDWFPLGWTGWISLQSKGLSRAF